MHILTGPFEQGCQLQIGADDPSALLLTDIEMSPACMRVVRFRFCSREFDWKETKNYKNCERFPNQGDRS